MASQDPRTSCAAKGRCREEATGETRRMDEVVHEESGCDWEGNDGRSVAEEMQCGGAFTSQPPCAKPEGSAAISIQDVGASYSAGFVGQIQGQGRMAESHPQRSKDDAAKNTHKTSAKELRSLVQAQGYKCAACGCHITPESCELDHLIPRDDGGSDHISNLQWLCVWCNRAKGTLPMSQFIDKCHKVYEHSSQHVS